MKLLPLIVCTLALFTAARATDSDVLKLREWVQGSFSTKLQADRDTHVVANRLRVTQFIDISGDSGWFFVEERLYTDTSMWKFRCIWHIQRVEEGMIELLEYDLPHGDEYDLTDLRGIGIGGKNFMIDVVSLRRRRGCEIYMQYDGSVFGGTTHGTACRTSESGGSYRLVDVKFMSDGMLLRERTYNSLREQVGGNQRAYEIFIRD